MSDQFLTSLVASLSEDLDTEVVEHTSDGTSQRALVALRFNEQQLQTATSRVVAARARLPISEREARESVDSAIRVAP